MKPYQIIENLEKTSASPEELMENVATAIDTVGEQMKFLEEIYNRKGNLRFGTKFCNCAFEEQQRLSLLSRALCNYQRDIMNTLTALQAPAGA